MVVVLLASIGTHAAVAGEEPSPPAEAISVDLDLEIDAGKTITGNVRGWLELNGDKAVHSLAHLQRLFERGFDDIRSALQPFGYYSPEVRGNLSAGADGIHWRASYEVVKGAPVRVGVVELSIDGLAAAQVAAMLEQIESTLGIGKRLRHQRYEQAKSNLQRELLSLGYLDASFERAALRVDVEARLASVDWKVTTGQAYVFGDVSVAQGVLHDSLVEKYLPVVSGEPFNTDRLISAQLALANSNYFDSVTLDILKQQAADGRVPVVFRTVPRKRRRYSAGLGYGTDTGPRAGLGLENRRVNRRGHKYRFDTRVSQIDSSLKFEYDVPVKNIASDRVRFSALLEEGNVGDADELLFALGVAQEDSWGPLRRRMFLNAERVRFGFGDEPTQRSTIVTPGFTLSWGTRDTPQRVRRGASVSVTALGGLTELGSSTDFASLRASARVIRPLSERMRVLGLLEARYLEAGNFNRLPPSQRFFLGGDRSVRGYAFQGISPENSAGDDIGGSHGLAASIEVDYVVSGNWALAAFVDAGQVDFDWPTAYEAAVGLGMRYHSPVGMIRLDLAHPLVNQGKDLRVHLSIGPDL